MAQLLPNPVPGFVANPGESFDAYIRRTDRLLSEMIAKSNDLPAGEVRGAIVSFSVADGRAHYLVKKVAPLVLQHIPFADGYQIDVATMRGLRLFDVCQRVNFARSLAAGARAAPAPAPQLEF